MGMARLPGARCPAGARRRGDRACTGRWTVVRPHQVKRLPRMLRPRPSSGRLKTPRFSRSLPQAQRSATTVIDGTGPAVTRSHRARALLMARAGIEPATPRFFSCFRRVSGVHSGVPWLGSGIAGASWCAPVRLEVSKPFRRRLGLSARQARLHGGSLHGPFRRRKRSSSPGSAEWPAPGDRNRAPRMPGLLRVSAEEAGRR